MSEQNTAALEQLYPHMNAEEIAKQRSLNEELVEYNEIPNSPFTIAYVKEQRLYYLLLGKTKMFTEGFISEKELFTQVDKKQWTLIMRVASTVCRDMIQPYIQWKSAQEAGIKVNRPEKEEIIDRMMASGKFEKGKPMFEPSEEDYKNIREIWNQVTNQNQ